MRLFRAVGKILLFSSWTVLLYGCYCFCFWSSQTRLRLKQFWIWGVRWLLGMRVKVEGVPPEQASFVVSNHLSYVDILLIWTQMDCVFVAKKDVETWFGLGRIAKHLGTIFIDRESKKDVLRVERLMREVVKSGKVLVFFPEGTSSAGFEVLPFRSALFDWPARMNAAVHWMCLSYATSSVRYPAHLCLSWWGEMGFLSHFWKLCQLREFEAKICFGLAPVLDSNRKLLATKAWRAVSDKFEPMICKESHEYAVV